MIPVWIHSARLNAVHTSFPLLPSTRRNSESWCRVMSTAALVAGGSERRGRREGETAEEKKKGGILHHSLAIRTQHFPPGDWVHPNPNRPPLRPAFLVRFSKSDEAEGIDCGWRWWWWWWAWMDEWMNKSFHGLSLPQDLRSRRHRPSPTHSLSRFYTYILFTG